MDCRHNMMHKHNSEKSIGFIRLASKYDRFVKGSDSVLRRKGEDETILDQVLGGDRQRN